ncbi:putative manganese transporter [Candidatus Bipolaricaulota bacterium]
MGRPRSACRAHGEAVILLADIVWHAFTHSIAITLFVFSMMLLVDYFAVLSRGMLESVVRGGRLRQYLGASLLGASPGCLGAFLSVSLYMRGFLSFGAIVGCMVATSGDEAFVMLALFPRTALLLFAALFLAGALSGWISDAAAQRLRIRPHPACAERILHPEKADCRCFDPGIWRWPWNLGVSRILVAVGLLASLGAVGAGWIGDALWIRVALFALLPIVLAVVLTVPEHYLREHILAHIVRRHLGRVLLWIFGALVVLEVGLQYWDLASFVHGHMAIVFLIAALLGLIPTSGPHLVFVTLFSQGIVPFSVLFVNSIVQDGHGTLPLLAHSVRDVMLIKAFNLVLGLAFGAILYVVGI